MGLDMYLYKRTYAGNNYKHREMPVKVSGLGIKQERVVYVTEQVAYWRKANAIHAWFVANCADGEDNCEEMRVSREQLEELLALVRKVLAGTKLVPGKVSNGYTIENGKRKHEYEDGFVVEDASVAQELLPTQEGFFFGSTDYDEGYVADLRHTEKMLADALAEAGENGSFGEASFFYEASW